MRSFSIVLLCAVFMGISACAQKVASDKVPPPVHAFFNAKFPKAEKVEWEMENDHEYEAEFKNGGLKQSAKFDKAGKWIETETEIKVSELPEVIKNAVAAEFPGFKLEEACKVESAITGMGYEVEVEKGKEEFDVLLDETGKVLNKSSEKEEEDED